MKKFLLKISVFALYALLLQAVFPVLVDPFNVFHAECIRANGVEPNQNYIKTKYILNNPEKFDSFLFGSSRVGVIHNDKIPGLRTYNMTYSAGLPSEHLANIKTFLKNKIHPAKVYIGIDSYAYTDEITDHINERLRCPYEYIAGDLIHLFELYLDPVMTRKSLKTMSKSNSKMDVNTFYQYGWWGKYGSTSKFNWNAENIKPSYGRRFSDETLRNALNDIKEIVNICRENNIELVIFTNPMHNITYMASVRELKYLDFLEGLADITEFYNFSSLNNLTLSNDNYLETSHYKAETGDLILNVICSDEIYPELYAQGFGVKVTRDNSEEFLAMLKRQAEEYGNKKQ
ncbi:MAG: hypothetical protein IJG34_04235 [Synergistaceae bacterium]|nr:hypothetical protein [Synergistaceae bacterium]